jgi:chromosomal replication initiator protein
MRSSVQVRSEDSLPAPIAHRANVGRAVSLLPAITRPGEAPARPGDAPMPHDRTPPADAPAPSGSLTLTPATPSPADLRRFAPDAARILADRLQALMGGARFDRYFAGGKAIEVVDDTLTVRVPSAMLANLLERHYGSLLLREARELTGHTDAAVRFVVTGQLHHAGPGVEADGARASTSASASANAPSVPPAATRTTADAVRVRAPRSGAAPLRHALSEFIVGPTNRLAFESVADGLSCLEVSLARPLASASTHARASSALSHPAPLLITSRCGLGKTHLLQSAVRAASDRIPGCSARYITADAFADEFISAIKAKKMDAFRRAFRHLDVLAIDDLSMLTGKLSTQSELQQTIDAIRARGGWIVAAASGPIRGPMGLSEALVSRISCGMSATIAAPDRAFVNDLVITLAQRRGMVLEPDAALALSTHAIAAAITSATTSATSGTPAGTTAAIGSVSIRDLEGLVTRVEAVHRLLGGRVTTVGAGVSAGVGTSAVTGGGVRVSMASVAHVLRPPTSSRESERSPADASRPVRLDAIVQAGCALMGVGREELAGKGRHVRVVFARAIIAMVALRVTTASYPDIARAIGRPNHSTIVTAVTRLRRQIEEGVRVPMGTGQEDASITDLCDRLSTQAGPRSSASRGRSAPRRPHPRPASARPPPPLGPSPRPRRRSPLRNHAPHGRVHSSSSRALAGRPEHTPTLTRSVRARPAA